MTTATVDQLVANDCKVLWVPVADVSSQSFFESRWSGSGKWVAPSEAVLVDPTNSMASAVIKNVGRRAGLYIPEVPSYVFKASTQSPIDMQTTF